eukprot:11184078-Lingulodinium_polyedra.AAC.1
MAASVSRWASASCSHMARMAMMRSVVSSCLWSCGDPAVARPPTGGTEPCLLRLSRFHLCPGPLHMPPGS